MFENFRRYQRFSVCAKAVIIRQDSVTPVSLAAQVNNISQGGMGLYTTTFIDRTTPVVVQFLNNGLSVMGVLEGKIASVTSHEEDFFVGIAFDREIPHDLFESCIN